MTTKARSWSEVAIGSASLRYFLTIIAIFSIYPTLFTFFYECVDGKPIGLASSVSEYFLSNFHFIVKVTPLVEEYTHFLQNSGGRCHVDLVKNIYAYNFAVLLISTPLILVGARIIFKELSQPNSIRQLRPEERNKTRKRIFLFSTCVLVGSCFLYSNNSINELNSGKFPGGLSSNKWLFLLDTFLVSEMHFIASMVMGSALFVFDSRTLEKEG